VTYATVAREICPLPGAKRSNQTGRRRSTSMNVAIALRHEKLRAGKAANEAPINRTLQNYQQSASQMKEGIGRRRAGECLAIAQGGGLHMHAMRREYVNQM